MSEPCAWGRRALRPGALLLCLSLGLEGCGWSGASHFGPEPRPGEEEAEEVARWMGRLGSGHYPQVERARFELQGLGRQAVPALRDAVQNGGPAGAEAVPTLLDMGSAASEALPMLLAIAADPDDRDPPQWPSRLSRRKVILEQARLAGWAADEWVPVLDQVWEDSSEDPDLRRLALESMVGMGLSGARSLVRALTEGPPFLRGAASHALRGWLASKGLDTEEAYHAWLLAADPLGADAPSHARMVRAGGVTPEALASCREAKAMLREELERSGDPDVALRLAGILQDEMTSDWLAALIPDTVRVQGQRRFDPREDLSALESAIRVGFGRAPRDSLFWSVLGVGLARTHLLRGDWSGMNEVLVQMGRPAVASDDQAWMSAPPRNWLDPSRPWQRAPAALCEGPCTLNVEVQNQDQPFVGAHVVLRAIDENTWDPTVDSGADPRLHFLLEQAPLSLIPTGGFGVPADRQEGTRYGVTGADGRVVLAGLPAGAWSLTLLVPVSTLPGEEGPYTLWQLDEAGAATSLAIDQPPASLDALSLDADAPERTLRYQVRGR